MCGSEERMKTRQGRECRGKRDKNGAGEKGGDVEERRQWGRGV